MASDYDFELESYYAYGFKGRPMIAVRAPFAMAHGGLDFVGRRARIDGRLYCILGVFRQITGPIAKGEPIGVEVEAI